MSVYGILVTVAKDLRIQDGVLFAFFDKNTQSKSYGVLNSLVPKAGNRTDRFFKFKMIRP